MNRVEKEFPEKCPKCRGIMQYFKDIYECRDCGRIHATYNISTKKYIKVE